MPTPFLYTILFDRTEHHSYCAMVVLLAISMQRYATAYRFVVFDYSQSEDVDEVLCDWRERLPFEVVRCHDAGLLADPMYCNVTSLSWDAPLRWIDDNPAPRKMVLLDADMLLTQPLDWLNATDGTSFLTYTRDDRDALGVSAFLAVLDMTCPYTRQLVALARSLNQKAYIWNHFKERTVRQTNYPDDEVTLEAAISILGKGCFKPLDWKYFHEHFHHYARHESRKYPLILDHAESCLEVTGLGSEYRRDFGEPRRIIFRQF